MSLMDKIKGWFSGSSGDQHEHSHDDGHDHSGHDHGAADTMPPAEPTGMAPPPVTSPEPMIPPAEPTEPERREDL
jgi:hypothetical protein